MSNEIKAADRLTSQLYQLPAIVGRLGLSIANAQHALNADYTENIKELARLVGNLVPTATTDEGKAVIGALLAQLAPSRYQFTETTLDFSADLSESLNVGATAGLGAGFGAVVVNAGVSVAYGRDYRAAARITTILNAIPADATVTQTFLARADKLFEAVKTLPPTTEPSKTIDANLRDILDRVGGKPAPKQPANAPENPPAGGQ